MEFQNAKIGDGATYRIHTDCLACTIVAISPGKSSYNGTMHNY